MNSRNPYTVQCILVPVPVPGRSQVERQNTVKGSVNWSTIACKKWERTTIYFPASRKNARNPLDFSWKARKIGQGQCHPLSDEGEPIGCSCDSSPRAV